MMPTAQLRSRGAHSPAAGVRPRHRRNDPGAGLGEEPRSDWRRAVAVVSERRVAEGRALYTERSCSSCCGVVQGGPEQRARALRPAGEPTRSEAALHLPHSRRFLIRVVAKPGIMMEA